MIYLDNAATYHPKSSRIPSAIASYLADVVSSPGRGGHRQAIKAEEILDSTRIKAQRLFSAPSSEQFHFCANATHGLNFIIQGLLETGNRVLTTALEHNSTLRPLKKMAQERQVEVDIVPCGRDGAIDPSDVIRAIRPHTQLVVLNHASNVIGTILDLEPIVKFCANHDILTLIDASQTAGLLPINLSDLPIDFLVTTGHKALRGPSGTGLIFSRSIGRLKPTLVGGTGGNSLSLFHPQNSHSIFEAGTPNYLGIAGLNAALEEILETPSCLSAEINLARFLSNHLRDIEGVTVYGPQVWTSRVPIVSFNIKALSPQFVLGVLDDDHDIIVRAGLHCAPLAHQMIGTAPGGTVRASLSHATTSADIEALIQAVSAMARVERHKLERTAT